MLLGLFWLLYEAKKIKNKTYFTPITSIGILEQQHKYESLYLFAFTAFYNKNGRRNRLKKKVNQIWNNLRISTETNNTSKYQKDILTDANNYQDTQNRTGIVGI